MLLEFRRVLFRSQQILQQAISTILRQPIDIVGAGRTDAGVHAKEMVAHFDTSLPISDTNKFLANLNSLLPADIAVYNLKAVAPDAHARFDATARTYQYWVITQKSPFYSQSACKVNHDLDFNLMNQAAQTLFDYQDFTSFSKLHTDVKTNNCTMMYAKWHQEGDKWIFTIKANRFLRNMVRSIVGTLFEVGKGKLSIEQFREVIEDRKSVV